METISQIVSPPLLAACAALSLGIGAALFFIYRRGAQGSLVLRAPLSWTEPIEIRLVLYMLFASACATAALVFRFLYMLPREGSAIAGLTIIITVLWALLMVAFLYATAGTLLQAALGARGRPEYWFFTWLSPLDRGIMSLGDMAGRLVLRPAPSKRKREPEYDEPVEVPMEEYEGEQKAARRRPPARNRRTPQEIARERLDAALAAYEATLTSEQLEKLHYIRSVTEWLRQSA